MGAIREKFNQMKDYLGFGDSLDDSDEEAYERYREEESRKMKSTTSSYSGNQASTRDVSAKNIKADRERSARMRAEAAAHGVDSTTKAHTNRYESTTYIDTKDNAKSLRMERPYGSKVIPINTTQTGYEVCIMKPTNIEDSQDICDVLLSNKIAIINLEEVDMDVAQRIMDFISGAVYTMNGKLHEIHGYIFIVSPETVDISGDYSEFMEQTGFAVPTFK